MASEDPLVAEAEQRQAARDQLLNSLLEKGDSLLAVESGDDPLEDEQEAQRAAMDSLVNSLVDKDASLLAVEGGDPVGGSGDPLVDEEQATNAARSSLIDSLVEKDTDTSLLAVEDGKPVEGSGDPLVDAQERARKARENLVKGLAKKDPSLEAEEPLDPEAIEAGLRAMNDFANIKLTAEDAKPSQELPEALQAAEVERQRILEGREEERQKMILEAEAQEKIESKAAALKVEEVERRTQAKTTVLIADPDHVGRYLEVSAADTTIQGYPKRHAQTYVKPGQNLLGTSGSQLRGAGTGTTELTQMFGGAFLLVAAVALFAVVGRRRKAAKREEEEDQSDYRLFM